MDKPFVYMRLLQVTSTEWGAIPLSMRDRRGSASERAGYRSGASGLPRWRLGSGAGLWAGPEGSWGKAARGKRRRGPWRYLAMGDSLRGFPLLRVFGEDWWQGRGFLYLLGYALEESWSISCAGFVADLDSLAFFRGRGFALGSPLDPC